MHFNAAAEQWTRAKHNRVDAESVSEEVVWPAGALYPLTWRSPTATLLFHLPLMVDSWKCMEWESCFVIQITLTRGGLIGQHYEITSLYMLGRGTSASWCVILFCGFVMENKVRPGADGMGCVSITGRRCLTLNPYKSWVLCLAVTQSLLTKQLPLRRLTAGYAPFFIPAFSKSCRPNRMGV